MLKHKSDETSRRGITFGNSIVRIADDHGYKNVALSSAIIAKDGTAEEQVSAIERTFAEGRELLLHWRKVTDRMYPSKPDLLDRIPYPSKLSLARLHKNGWLMTDTCATAQNSSVYYRSDSIVLPYCASRRRSIARFMPFSASSFFMFVALAARTISCCNFSEILDASISDAFRFNFHSETAEAFF